MFKVEIISCLIIGLAINTDAKCPSLFEEYNMACYYFGNNAVSNVGSAYQTCSSLGGYLVNINAKAEYNHIVKRLKDQFQVHDGYWTGGVWAQRLWRWVKTDLTGTTKYEIMDPGANQYNWGPNQPDDNHLGFRPENNVALVVRGGPRVDPYKWWSVNEYQPGYSYICEADWVEEK